MPTPAFDRPRDVCGEHDGSGCGVAFKMNPAGKETVLYTGDFLDLLLPATAQSAVYLHKGEHLVEACL